MQQQDRLTLSQSEGPLSDPSGTLFIKPCTQTEIEFYETANASYTDLAAFMPTFLGTLSLQPQSNATLDVDAVPAITTLYTPTTASASASASASTQSSLEPIGSQPTPVVAALKGKKLNTDVHIVLQNAASGFTRANVLDLKLGARLWDDDSPPEKRARLDAVSKATTSSSLGFRIAGMRTYQGSSGRPSTGVAEEAARLGHGELEADTNMFSFNKLFGRKYKGKEVIEGFKHFVLVPEAGISRSHALALVDALLDGTTQLRSVLEYTQLRMYSASILFVYEGDGEVFDRKHEAVTASASNATLADLAAGAPSNDAIDKEHEAVDDADDEADDDEQAEDPNKLLSIKLIDFAHAHFVPWQGPDRNILLGLDSIIDILETLQKELAAPEDGVAPPTSAPQTTS